MKIFPFLLGIAVFLSFSCSEDNSSGTNPGDNGTTYWIEQNSGTNEQPRDIFFLNANEGWICGANGTILHTTDGGDVWRPQNSGTNRSIISLHFTDALNGWAVGTNGLKLHTSDGGSTWETKTSSTLYTFWGVHFINPAKGFIVGEYLSEGCVIYSTADSGDTWQSDYYRRGNLIYNFREINFINSQSGYIIGENGWFLTTSDGGTTWDDKSGNATFVNIFGIDFLTSEIAFATDYNGGIHKTIDGGNSWTQIYSVVRAFAKVGFANQSTGWAAGAQGNIIFTNDGGNSWSEQRGLTDQSCEDMFVLDRNNVWIIYTDSRILKYQPQQ